MSGGGAKGAFAVGVIKHLFEKYSENNWFSIVGGTSTGALIAPMAALISEPDPVRKKAMETLEHLYSNVTTPDILEKQDVVELLIRHDCLYESDPLHTLIYQHLTDDWFNRLKQTKAPDCYVVYTNYQSGKKVVASPKDANMTRERFIKCMMASASVPVVMEATMIDDEVCYDGGVRDLLPFSHAIDLGAEIIVPIFLEPERFNETKSKFKRVDKILLRTLSILMDEVGINDHKMAGLVNTAIQAKAEILDTFKNSINELDKLKNIFNNPKY
ncbi:MAG: patatin-like phospholipase family protein [Promethearchaeota archaeon]